MFVTYSLEEYWVEHGTSHDGNSCVSTA